MIPKDHVWKQLSLREEEILKRMFPGKIVIVHVGETSIRSYGLVQCAAGRRSRIDKGTVLSRCFFINGPDSGDKNDRNPRDGANCEWRTDGKGRLYLVATRDILPMDVLIAAYDWWS